MNAKALCCVLCPVVLAGGYSMWPKSQAAPSPTPAPAAASAAAKPAPLAVEVVELLPAIEGGVLKAEARGNGRERLRLTLRNKGRAPVSVTVPVGQIFESERSTVVVVRPEAAEIAPGRSVELKLQTASTRSLTKVVEATYRPASSSVPKVELLLGYVQDHPELTPGAIQTAVLALTDNLPVSSVAKFQPMGGKLASRFNTDGFRAETVEIIQALTALRDIGVADHDLAMTIDPQLKLEAMIEPLSRAAAMRYYSIAPQQEWEYWKSELTTGEPTTRHYALYGIARFYPEVALEMLPKWARETKTTPVYRLSAIQALADTQRPEALPILRDLADELGTDTDLGKAAAGAAHYLDSHLTQTAANGTTVAFRAAKVGGL